MKLWLVLIVFAVMALAVIAWTVVLIARWLGAVLESHRRNERWCGAGMISIKRPKGKDANSRPMTGATPEANSSDDESNRAQ